MEGKGYFYFGLTNWPGILSSPKSFRLKAWYSLRKSFWCASVVNKSSFPYHTLVQNASSLPYVETPWLYLLTCLCTWNKYNFKESGENFPNNFQRQIHEGSIIIIQMGWNSGIYCYGSSRNGANLHMLSPYSPICLSIDQEHLCFVWMKFWFVYHHTI